jgi:hypothetical protein
VACRRAFDDVEDWSSEAPQATAEEKAAREFTHHEDLNAASRALYGIVNDSKRHRSATNRWKTRWWTGLDLRATSCCGYPHEQRRHRT